eukprot:TRINITY_DN75955_c0_g1_i1.p1 TRINITY_DN75955_c0_g1~~TRINITY_DN75955_c0_g1_i1.p1  ORF type:complete len:140 (+),score=0.31 TRINITY_DN75955_c0_g1_i1:33-452(+)
MTRFILCLLVGLVAVVCGGRVVRELRQMSPTEIGSEMSPGPVKGCRCHFRLWFGSGACKGTPKVSHGNETTIPWTCYSDGIGNTYAIISENCTAGNYMLWNKNTNCSGPASLIGDIGVCIRGIPTSAHYSVSDTCTMRM